MFFGRDEETSALLDHLSRAPVLTVLGNSGSGKSSLVRAGLIPSLQQRRFSAKGVAPGWRIAIFRPTGRPFEELSERLLAQLATTQMSAEERVEIRKSVAAGEVRDALVRLVGKDLGHDRVLLFADQFEEIFTQVSDRVPIRSQYIEALLTAVRMEGDLPVHLVVAMRADFYPRCLEFPRLKQAIEVNLYGVSRMQRAALREAVLNRLALAGANSSDGLVDLLLEDVGDEPGNLALLEHALDQVWRKKLSLVEYTKSRQLSGVLAQHADEVYRDFKDEPDQKMVERIFVELVQTAEGSPDTRRPVAKSRLMQLDEPTRVERVLERLASARLITTAGDDGERHVA